jgi:hypothetical protein
LLALQVSPTIAVCTPNRAPNGPQPTASLGVSNKTRISRMGRNICNRCRMSVLVIRMSSVRSPIASIPCLRDWNMTDRNKHIK